jgi:membrane protein implicated in regulation of membrane protease activity
MHTSTAPKTIKLFAIAGLGEVYQAFAEGHGRIKFHGSFWPAQLHQVDSQPAQVVDGQSYQSYLRHLTPGELVLVVGRFGLTLLVQPYDANLPTDVLEPGSAL